MARSTPSDQVADRAFCLALGSGAVVALTLVGNWRPASLSIWGWTAGALLLVGLLLGSVLRWRVGESDPDTRFSSGSVWRRNLGEVAIGAVSTVVALGWLWLLALNPRQLAPSSWLPLMVVPTALLGLAGAALRLAHPPGPS